MCTVISGAKTYMHCEQTYLFSLTVPGKLIPDCPEDEVSNVNDKKYRHDYQEVPHLELLWGMLTWCYHSGGFIMGSSSTKNAREAREIFEATHTLAFSV